MECGNEQKEIVKQKKNIYSHCKLTGLVYSYFFLSHSQIMNPFTLIGFFLVLFCAMKYVNAVPIATDASESALTAENLTTVRNNEQNLDNLLYNTNDSIKSSENVSLNQSTIEQTTQKPQNDAQKTKSKTRKRVYRRRRTRTQPDCRPVTTEKPTTPKPTQLGVLLPNLFISQSWGPGR